MPGTQETPESLCVPSGLGEVSGEAPPLRLFTDQPLPFPPGAFAAQRNLSLERILGKARRALPVDGGGVPHVEVGGADPLQERLGQLRRDVIDGVQLLGGVVIADEQSDLVDKHRKVMQRTGVAVAPARGPCCVIPDTVRHSRCRGRTHGPSPLGAACLREPPGT